MMAEQDPIRVARENIEAFNAGDWQRVKATLAPDSVYDEVGTQRRLRGADEIDQALQSCDHAIRPPPPAAPRSRRRYPGKGPSPALSWGRAAAFPPPASAR